MLEMHVRTVRALNYTVTVWLTGCNAINVKVAINHLMPLLVRHWLDFATKPNG